MRLILLMLLTSAVVLAVVSIDSGADDVTALLKHQPGGWYKGRATLPASSPALPLYAELDKTFHAESAVKLQGHADARIKEVRSKGKGKVLVAQITNVSGPDDPTNLFEDESVYGVSGVLDPEGSGTATTQATPPNWAAQYDNDPRRILAWVNQRWRAQDDYVGVGLSGNLFLVLTGDENEESYNVTLTDTPTGGAVVPSFSPTLGKVGDMWVESAMVLIRGESSGPTTIDVHCSHPAVKHDEHPTLTVVDVYVVVHPSDTDTQAVTQGGVADNFVRVKGTGDMILEAVVEPDTPDVLAAMSWSADGLCLSSPGLPGDVRTAKVSTDATGKGDLRIALGDVTCWRGTAWSVWADLRVAIADMDTIDAGNDATFLLNGQFPAMLGGGNRLGELSIDDTPGLLLACGVGRMQAKATLTPAGIEGVIKWPQWRMRRWVTGKRWSNGGHYENDQWSPGPMIYNQDDSSFSPYLDEDPHSGTSVGEIYDVDVPGVGSLLNILDRHTGEVYYNFRQYVTVFLMGKEVTCSDDVLWSYEGRVDIEKASPRVERNRLALQHVEARDSSYYIPRFNISGAITKNGQGLGLVSVSAGDKSTVTLADGTYTITGVAIGDNIAITPAKVGETFTPAIRTVNVINQNVQGQDFTAN